MTDRDSSSLRAAEEGGSLAAKTPLRTAGALTAEKAASPSDFIFCEGLKSFLRAIAAGTVQCHSDLVSFSQYGHGDRDGVRAYNSVNLWFSAQEARETAAALIAAADWADGLAAAERAKQEAA